MVDYVPDRGDIVWLDFEPQQGKEISKVRPALVISPQKYNLKAGLAIFVPITSKVKGYPFEVVIECKQILGAVLSDQVKSLDWRVRKISKIMELDKMLLGRVIDKIKLLIG